MIGFFLYFLTAFGIVFPVTLSFIEGKIPWSSVLEPVVLGAPVLLTVAAFFAVFMPRLAGVLAFAGCVSCWINSGMGIASSIRALVTPENLSALGNMETPALLSYGLGWVPTVSLIFATLYAFYRSLKLPKECHDQNPPAAVPSPPPA